MRLTVKGIVCNKIVSVKHCPDFKVFPRNHARNVKYYFPDNFLHGWRFQKFNEIKKYIFGVIKL